MSQERYPKEHHFPSHHELFLFVKTHFLLEISSSQTPMNVHSVHLLSSLLLASCQAYVSSADGKSYL